MAKKSRAGIGAISCLSLTFSPKYAIIVHGNPEKENSVKTKRFAHECVAVQKTIILIAFGLWIAWQGRGHWKEMLRIHRENVRRAKEEEEAMG